MIIPRDTITEIQRHGEGVATVTGKPPEIGSTFWVRASARTNPVCEVRVADLWLVEHGDDAGAYELVLKPVKPGFRIPRKPSEKREFRLTRAQRSRVFDGDASPLLFETEPKCEKGNKIILSWSRPKRVYDKKTRRVSTPPREPLLWIEVRSKARRPADEGGWEVRFRIEDRRPLKTRLLRQTPPVYAPEMMKEDLDRELDDDTIAEAREESSYTTSPRTAIDTLEAVDDDTLDQFAEEASRGAAQAATLQQARRERHDYLLRLARVERDAATAGADISSARRVIERQLRKMEKRVYEGKIDEEAA